MSQKKMSTANFNIVFYKDSEKIGTIQTTKEMPLLECFDTIVMPALTSREEQRVGENKYQLFNVRITKTLQGDFVLSGIMVKKTTIEIKSDVDEKGHLVLRDETYTTAPLSTFVVYLRNHRMIFVQNQKGSPTLKQFAGFIKYLIDGYIDKENRRRQDLKIDLLPQAYISIMGMPAPTRLEEAFKDVKKVTKLTLQFFPLNGDTDFNFGGVFGGQLTELRQMVDSKTGSLIMNSPKNIEGVKTVIIKSEGTVNPIVEIERTNNTKGRIKDNTISETGYMELEGIEQDKDIEAIVRKGSELESLSRVSEENNKIYEKNVNVISKFAK